MYNNEIHILGGNTYPTRHYKWNGSSWVSVSTLPFSCYENSAVVFKGCIYVIHGVAIYKFNGSSWTQVLTLEGAPIYKSDISNMVVFNDKIHIFDIYNNYVSQMYDVYDDIDGSTMYVYHYTYDETNLSHIEDLPFSVSDCNAFVFRDKMYLIGKVCNKVSRMASYYYALYKYDGSRWYRSTKSLPISAVKMTITGIEQSDGDYLDIVHAFNVSGDHYSIGFYANELQLYLDKGNKLVCNTNDIIYSGSNLGKVSNGYLCNLLHI